MSKSNSKSLQGVQRLVEIGNIKVWSLAVTVIADLSMRYAISPSGPALNALFARMNVKPEALRVALHRLRKEGWILSDKSGRTSRYRLSKQGAGETKAVWDSIYVPNHKIDEQWQITICPASVSESIKHAVKLSPSTYITKRLGHCDVADSLVCPVNAVSIPVWVEDKILTDGLGDLAEKLTNAVNGYAVDLAKNDDPVDVMAIRMLALHHWRRIALRDAAWLHLQQFEQGAIRQCHDAVHALLRKIEPANVDSTLGFGLDSAKCRVVG